MSLRGSPGRVINITSVGGKYGAPFMGAYSASKHAVEGMSDSLRRELLPFGIDVLVVGELYRQHSQKIKGLNINVMPNNGFPGFSA